MTALLERLEGAREADRRIDAEIGTHFGGQVISRFGGYEWRADGKGIWHTLPNFTGSIDAALALAERVLPGWGVNLFNGDPCHGDNRYCKARLWSNDNPPLGIGFDGSAKTLPLAICAALIRATAKEEAGG